MVAEDALREVLQRVKLIAQHRQQRGVHLAEQLPNLGQRLRALRQRRQVAA